MLERLQLILLIVIYLFKARLITFKRMAPHLGKQTSSKKEMPYSYSPKQLKVLSRLHRAIPIIARYLPWQCLCLPQAYACARILQCYEIPYHFCLGATFLHDEKKKFSAHAWIECQGKIIIGGQSSRENFSVLPIYYAWNGCLKNKEKK